MSPAKMCSAHGKLNELYSRLLLIEPVFMLIKERLQIGDDH